MVKADPLPGSVYRQQPGKLRVIRIWGKCGAVVSSGVDRDGRIHLDLDFPFCHPLVLQPGLGHGDPVLPQAVDGARLLSV